MKSVLITGASRGIGLAIAEEFAKNGYTLYLTCKSNIELLHSAAQRFVDRYGVKVFIDQVDCSDYEQMEQVFSAMDNLDVLVNNAGISYVGLLQDMSLEDWDKVINTNLTSAFINSKLAIPKMLPRKFGSIINIASVWGDVGASCEVAYSASKGGMIAFTKALAKELAPSGIKVNALELGMIDTEMNKCFSEEEIADICEDIPVGRMGKVSEVAKTAFMIAESPAYLTGSVIKIDGGWI